jgi:ribosomal protein S18
MEKTTKKQRKLNSLNKKENNLKEKISKILVKYKVSKIDYEDMETLINSLIENEINKGNL